MKSRDSGIEVQLRIFKYIILNPGKKQTNIMHGANINMLLLKIYFFPLFDRGYLIKKGCAVFITDKGLHKYVTLASLIIINSLEEVGA